MSRIYLVLSLFVHTLAGFAQSPPPPAGLVSAQLKQQIAKATTDSSRSRLLCLLGKEYTNSNADSSAYFLRQSLQVARRGQDTVGVTRAMYWLADLSHYHYKDEGQTLSWLNKAVWLAKASNDNLHLARCYEMMSFVAMHQRIGNPDELLAMALYHAKKAGDWEVLGNVYTSLSFRSESLNDYESSVQFTRKGMDFVRPHSLDMWFTYGLDYCELREKQGKHALAMSMVRELTAAKNNLARTEGMFVYTNDLARLALLQQHYDEAESILVSGLNRENNQPKPDSLHLFHYYTTLMNLHLKTGDYQKAYQRSMILAEVRLWLQRVRQTRDSKLRMTQLQARLNIQKKELEITRISAQQQQQLLMLLGVSVIAILLVGFMVVLYRSQQRIRQQRTALAELNNVKDQLFSIVSHDLRGPVMSLQQSLDRLETSTNAATTLPELPRFRQSVNAVASLTDNMLCWALSQMGGLRTRPQPVALFDIVSDVVALYQETIRQKNIDLIVSDEHSGEAAPLVLADENQAEIAIRNLVQNALKFSPAGGKITLSVEPQNGAVSLLIIDEGPGFDWQPGETLPNKTLTRASTNSTGLGLTVVEDLMHRNGGKLMISRRTDGPTGTQARLTWPVAGLQPPAMSAAPVRERTHFIGE